MGAMTCMFCRNSGCTCIPNPDRTGGVPWHGVTADLYALMIESRVHFAQANYGDGEWGCILGLSLTNSQGETYVPELRDALRRTLLEPVGMWHGYNPGKKLFPDAEAWLREHDARVQWIHKDALSAANVNGRFGPVLRAIRTRQVVLVGPEHLREIPQSVIGDYRYISVPDSTAWQVSADTAAEVRGVMRPGDLVLFASGMATNLTIHRLWPEVRDSVTLLDIGACLDPYVGVESRSAYRKHGAAEIVRRNLEVSQ